MHIYWSRAGFLGGDKTPFSEVVKDAPEFVCVAVPSENSSQVSLTQVGENLHFTHIDSLRDKLTYIRETLVRWVIHAGENLHFTYQSWSIMQW